MPIRARLATVAWAIIVAVVAATMSMLTPATSMAAVLTETTTGSISGTVELPDGISMGSTRIRLFGVAADDTLTPAGDVWVNSTTQAFAFPNLTEGRYKLRLEAVTTNLLDMWWGGADVSTAGVVELGPGEARTGLVFAPTKGSVISGRVTFPSDANPQGNRAASAYAYHADDPNGDFVRAVTIEPYSGTYRIDRLPAGEYKVRFLSSGSPAVNGEWWDDTLEPELAEVVSLDTGETRSGIDALLSSELRDLIVGSPTITGVARVGQLLSAETGVWTPGTSFHYTWYADDAVVGYGGAIWIGQGQIGKSIRVQVTGSKSKYRSSSASSSSTTPVLGLALAAGTPQVVGEPQVGVTLWGNPGLWDNAAMLTYEWLADGEPIEGETDSHLTPTGELFGTRLSVRVTGTRVGYEPTSATSAETEPVAAGISSCCFPTITGEPRVGEILTADPGPWIAGTDFSYEWLADGVALAGETESSLLLSPAHEGRQISVRVTGETRGYVTHTEQSSSTSPVLALAIAPSAPRSVVGVARDRQVLVSWTAPESDGGSPVTSYKVTASPGGASVVTAGETSAVMTGLANGIAYTLTVTALNSVGESPESAPSARVTPQPAGSGAPERQAGPDRFATSAAISAATYASGVPVVYIANGYNFPDALSGAATAGSLGGPVLLTAPDSLPAVIAQELDRLNPQKIVILGGTAVVTDTVLNQAKGYLP